MLPEPQNNLVSDPWGETWADIRSFVDRKYKCCLVQCLHSLQNTIWNAQQHPTLRQHNAQRSCIHSQYKCSPRCRDERPHWQLLPVKTTEEWCLQLCTKLKAERGRILKLLPGSRHIDPVQCGYKRDDSLWVSVPMERDTGTPMQSYWKSIRVYNHMWNARRV